MSTNWRFWNELFYYRLVQRAIRAQNRKRSVRRQNFYELPRDLQDRFINSTKSQSEPKPLLFHSATSYRIVAWVGLTILCFLGIVILCSVGYGQLDNPLARHGIPIAVLFVLLTAGIVVGIVQAIVVDTKTKSLPFAPGYYCFAGVAVDARDASLSLYPISELSGLSAKGASSIVATFGKTSITFTVASGQAAQAVAAVQSAHDDTKKPMGDVTKRYRDPFISMPQPALFGSNIPIDAPSRAWWKVRFGLPIILGLLGLVIFKVRDSKSDESLFKKARVADSVDAYKKYLSVGDHHREEVNTVLLPRAELRAIADIKSVKAVDEFVTTHPQHKIADEILVVRQTALVKEFEDARGKGTLDALLAYEKSFPKHHLATHVQAAREEIYRKAAKDTVAKIPAESPNTRAFVAALIQWAGKQGAKETPQGLRGPVVDVVFQRVPSKTLKHVDLVIKNNPYYVGKGSFIGPHVAYDQLEPLETESAKKWAAELSKLVDPRIMSFGAGKAIENSDTAGPKKPRVVVAYRFEHSGAIVTKSPRGIFMGMGMFFRIEGQLPGKPVVAKSKSLFRTKVPQKLIRDFKAPTKAGEVERAVYHNMISDAFEQGRQAFFDKNWFQ